MKKVIVNVIKKIAAAAAAFTLTLTGFASYNNNIEASAAEVPSNYTDLVDEMAVLVNQAREEAGLAPVAVVPVLNDVANVRADESSALFSHTRPNGAYFDSTLYDFGISFGAAGENLAAGYSSVEETFEQWKNSPGHWANIMNPSYTHIGIGVCYDANSTYGWYWSQNFIASNQEFYGQYTPVASAKTVNAPEVTYGDIDGNGSVNAIDLVLVLKSLTTNKALSSAQIESADCLHDGQITLSDAIVIKKYILGQYDVLPMNI